MQGRIITCVAVVALAPQAAAGELDDAFLRGSQAPAPIYRVGGRASSSAAYAGVPVYQVNPVYRVNGVGPVRGDVPPHAPVSKDPIAPVVAVPAWSWTGFYVGAHVGATAGIARFGDGTAIFGDKVMTPGFLGGGQAGFNWQAPNSDWVLGVAVDAGWLASDGIGTCLASSGFFLSATCHADPNAIGTFTARAGRALGEGGRTLAYVKGGAAWIHENNDVVRNAGNFSFGGVLFPGPATTASAGALGWTVGVGVERALSPAWSASLEYDYLDFASAGVSTPQSLMQVVPGVNGYTVVPGGATAVSQTAHQVKLGVNYRIGADPFAQWGAPPALSAFSGWEFASGTRVWVSSGKFQWNVGTLQGAANSDISRLTYDGLTGTIGELFERIDSPVGIFIKGNVGLGTIYGGHQNDEDWLIFGGTVPYSNTLSSTNNGKLGYGTFDGGYNILTGRDYRLGAFAGYNYFTERWDTLGCSQIANLFSDCVVPIAGSTVVGTQDSTWQSLRVGLSAETLLFDRLRIVGDVAYLPHVSMVGRDNHLARQATTFIDQQGSGQGVQVEAVLSFLVTDSFSVGAGGRYWSMWTTGGTDICTGCGGAGVVSPQQPSRFSTERYGAFLQADYRFGMVPAGP
jgi:opacity protein-like surface antigen